jgi:hypothetical protein
LCGALYGTLYNLLDSGWRVHTRVPGVLGIAPRTTYIATSKANKIGGLSCVKALALNRVEILYEW